MTIEYRTLQAIAKSTTNPTGISVIVADADPNAEPVISVYRWLRKGSTKLKVWFEITCATDLPSANNGYTSPCFLSVTVIRNDWDVAAPYDIKTDLTWLDGECLPEKADDIFTGIISHLTNGDLT